MMAGIFGGCNCLAYPCMHTGTQQQLYHSQLQAYAAAQMQGMTITTTECSPTVGQLENKKPNKLLLLLRQ